MKRNELSIHTKTWKNLKCILLSEGSQFEKSMYCMIPFIKTFWKRQIYKDENRSMVARGSEERMLNR